MSHLALKYGLAEVLKMFVGTSSYLNVWSPQLPHLRKWQILWINISLLNVTTANQNFGRWDHVHITIHITAKSNSWKLRLIYSSLQWHWLSYSHIISSGCLEKANVKYVVDRTESIVNLLPPYFFLRVLKSNGRDTSFELKMKSGSPYRCESFELCDASQYCNKDSSCKLSHILPRKWCVKNKAFCDNVLRFDLVLIHSTSPCPKSGQIPLYR